LCSDGVDDNYPVDENEKHLYKLYRTIALTFAEDGFESTYKQLIDLANQFATKGKGDDTSIAGFINMEGLKKAVPIWKKQIAEEEARLKTETKAESQETTVLKNAAAEYQRNMGPAKNGMSDYGDFLFSKPYTGKK